MVRVSLTGLLSVVGAILLVFALSALVPPVAWEPVCLATETFKEPCLRGLVRQELTSAEPRIETTRLLDWCGPDELCRIDVLTARPAADAHAQRALCEMWAPSFQLACEQGLAPAPERR